MVGGRQSIVRQNSSFASGTAYNHGPFLSCDNDFFDERCKDDLTALEHIAERKTRYKVALIGPSQAGKTSLAYRFIDRGSFLDEYVPTIVDTYESEMNMIDPSDGLNRVVNLTIKDIGHTMLKDSMILDADALLFCYDVTNEESFFALSSLFQMKMQVEYSQNDGEEEDDNEAMSAITTLS